MFREGIIIGFVPFVFSCSGWKERLLDWQVCLFKWEVQNRWGKNERSKLLNRWKNSYREVWKIVSWWHKIQVLRESPWTFQMERSKVVNSGTGSHVWLRMQKLWCQTDLVQFHALPLIECGALDKLPNLRPLLHKMGITILIFNIV